MLRTLQRKRMQEVFYLWFLHEPSKTFRAMVRWQASCRDIIWWKHLLRQGPRVETLFCFLSATPGPYQVRRTNEGNSLSSSIPHI